MAQYQTFGDASGHSDSAAKLAALRLPDRIDNWSVLDIGCNEGFFCQTAWERGAGSVVGLDRSEEFLERARERDARTDYRLMDWSRLHELEETFDLVLFLSSLHYSSDPELLLRDAFDRLKPDGILMLECGVAPGRDASWEKIHRPRGDTVLHPTHPMIMRAIPASVVRKVGPSVEQPGDPLPRAVYRIVRRRPFVLLVEGRSGSGKSTLTQTLLAEDYVAISLDHMIWTIPDWCEDDFLISLRTSRNYKENEIGQIGQRIAAADASDRFVRQVLARRPDVTDGTHPVGIIEGHALGSALMAAAFSRRLTQAGAFVWHLRASDVRPHPKRGK